MSKLRGTNIAASIVPFDSRDQYNTHDSIYGKGGFREVDTLEDRDQITKQRRRQGMLVYVKSEKKVYQLIDEPTNTYEEFRGASTIIRKDKFSDLPSVGEPDKFYICLDELKTYIWDSEQIQFVCITKDFDYEAILCGNSD